MGFIMDYCKVLIIEDEFITRQGLKYMIEWEKEGFQIVGEGSNGQEGLELVEKLSPHIVLVDIVMPIIDGLEFSKIVSRKFPNIKIIVISSHDKFDYVRTALVNGATDYILKPTLNPTNLLTSLKTTASKIPSLSLAKQEMPFAIKAEKYLLGYGDTLDTSEVKDVFNKGIYRMLAIDLKAILNVNKESITNIKNMVESQFYESQTYPNVSVFLNESIVCVLLNYDLDDEKSLIKECSELAEKVRGMYQGAFFVMSRNFYLIKEIKDYYESDIKTELSNGFYYFDTPILITEKPKEEVKLNKFSFDMFSFNLSKGNYRNAYDLFKEYTFYMIENKKDPYRLKNITKNLLYNYLIEIEKFFENSEDVRSTFFYKMDNCVDSLEFTNICNELFEVLDQNLKEKVEVEDFRIFEIKEYVDKNFDQQLELSDIASKFNFSYTYLSSYFSQMSKEGFSEYLNKVRIDKACEKLIKTDESIANIGTGVGYSDHSYFCRVFKKLTGETPSSYRKRRINLK